MAAASAHHLLLFLLVAASLLASSPSAARPCHTYLVSFSSLSNPNANADTDADHPIPLTTTVVTVFRVRRLGPHHSLPAALQIGRPEPIPAAEASSSLQERAKDILVDVVGLLFGFGCGALTAASIYLVWSALAAVSASYEDEDEESDSESPKKAGYVTIPDNDAYGGKN